MELIAPVLKFTCVLTERTNLERAVGREGASDVRVVKDRGEEKWIYDFASFCVGVARVA